MLGFDVHGTRSRRAAILAAGLALVIASCSGSTASPSASSQAPSAPPSTAAPGGSAAASPSGSGAAGASMLAPATLEVWLGGVLTTSTPGSTYRHWVDAQIDRFKAAVPGSDVHITLLPADNDQLAAQVQAAFASHTVPDVIMLYSGSYTTAYQSALLPLNTYIDATPGFYDQFSGWDASCVDLDCKGGQGTILAVPMDVLAFVMWYNKSLFGQAGVSSPPTTYEHLYGVCDALNAKGITPMTYGDRDGYTTDNLVLMNLVSYFEPGDVQKFIAGQLPFTDPKWVEPLKAVVELHARHCAEKDASTREQLDANNDFITSKQAIEEAGPWFLPSQEQGLGDALGVAKLPVSGNGPWKDKTASNSGEDWAIPKDAAHPDLAWEFIKTVTDATASAQYAKDVGYPPANIAGAATVQDPYIQTIAGWTKDSPMPLMDNVMSQATALTYYRYIQQAFAGAITPEQAMQSVQDSLQGGTP